MGECPEKQMGTRGESTTFNPQFPVALMYGHFANRMHTRVPIICTEKMRTHPLALTFVAVEFVQVCRTRKHRSSVAHVRKQI